jgi:DNA-binding winged helix-turn-helix (wHTH) protein
MQPFLDRAMKEAGPRFFDSLSLGREEAAPAKLGETIEFGRFTVRRRPRRLLADGVPVALGARAFGILMALIEADGGLVSKRQLLSRVWPDTLVEESNLRVQIAGLRKALGRDRDFVRTEAGRGYRFCAAIGSDGAAPNLVLAAAATNLPIVSKIAQPVDPSAIALQLARIDEKLSQALSLLAASNKTPAPAS